MWVFTPFGILMPGRRPDGTIPEGDERTLQIRARDRRHLEILRDEYMGDELGEIIHLPNTDYQFRAYCTPMAWATACAHLALRNVEYVKFKEQTEVQYGDRKLHNLYTRIWGVIFEAYPDGSSYSRPAPWWIDPPRGDSGKGKGKRGSRRGRRAERHPDEPNGWSPDQPLPSVKDIMSLTDEEWLRDWAAEQGGQAS